MSVDARIYEAADLSLMRSILQRIATGPDLSKDISRQEACEAMTLVLEQRVDPVQAGVFLIAMRMKRETHDENLGVLDAIRNATKRIAVSVDEVLEIADPYNGYTRALPASPFLPPLLAACGVATVTHGVESVGPKFGVTHHQVLKLGGVPVDNSLAQVAERLQNPAIGWAYVDQRVFCPALHDLNHLRTLIVKRPVLTTVEVLAGPVKAAGKTHLMTGYVHKPYPPVYALLARESGFNSALLVRGVEGGVIPSLRQKGKCFRYTDFAAEQAVEFHPADIGIDTDMRAVAIPEHIPGSGSGGDKVGMSLDVAATALAAADKGIKALQGEDGPSKDALVLGASLCLWHLARADSFESAAVLARDAITSGAAFRRFQAASS